MAVERSFDLQQSDQLERVRAWELRSCPQRRERFPASCFD
jgi:hypothetical protein